MRTLIHHGDRLARECEANGKYPTDRTRANDCDFHFFLLQARPVTEMRGTTILMRSYVKLIGQRPNPIDDDADRAAGLHRTHADRSAAGDDVTWFQRHVLRDEAYQLRRRKDDV